MWGDEGAAYNSLLGEAYQLIIEALFCGGERDISRALTVLILNKTYYFLLKTIISY